MRPVALALTFVFFAGCAVTTDDHNHYPRPWLEDGRVREWTRLQSIKAEANKDSEQPQMQEFKGAGTMFVWKHSLDGGPGWEHVRISYTYKNTTGSKFDWVRVWLEILDPDGRVTNRDEELLINPLGVAISPGDTWSDTMKVPTRGLHRMKGWSWRIGCEPVHMKVLAPRGVAGK